MPQKVLVASDHSIIREGIVELLHARRLHSWGAPLADGSKTDDKPDLVLFVGEARPDLAATLEQLQSRASNAPLLCLLLSQDNVAALSALRAGAKGIIDDSFSADQLVESIQQCVAGEFVMSKSLATQLARQYALDHENAAPASSEADLTGREQEVLALLAEGGTNRQMADQLCLSEHTVRAHLRAIMQKLQVSNRVQAATIAWQGGLSRRVGTTKGR